ncbi:hypothetical protein LZ30DRAFT_399054 [Colletotrichum cereale]|nr:hypothetical protein LZ30DRAFT_399054 [Colletotrichum cereale]
MIGLDWIPLARVQTYRTTSPLREVLVATARRAPPAAKRRSATSGPILRRATTGLASMVLWTSMSTRSRQRWLACIAGAWCAANAGLPLSKTDLTRQRTLARRLCPSGLLRVIQSSGTNRPDSLTWAESVVFMIIDGWSTMIQGYTLSASSMYRPTDCGMLHRSINFAAQLFRPSPLSRSCFNLGPLLMMTQQPVLRDVGRAFRSSRTASSDHSGKLSHSQASSRPSSSSRQNSIQSGVIQRLSSVRGTQRPRRVAIGHRARLCWCISSVRSRPGWKTESIGSLLWRL